MMILACNLSNHQFNLFSPEPLDMSLEEIVCLKVRTFVEKNESKQSGLQGTTATRYQSLFIVQKSTFEWTIGHPSHENKTKYY